MHGFLVGSIVRFLCSVLQNIVCPFVFYFDQCIVCLANHENEWSCLCLLGVWILPLSFYDFSIGFFSFSDNVVLFCLSFYFKSICILPPVPKGPGGSMSYVVGIPHNSYKPITNTACFRARLCKLQKRCTRLAAASDKAYQLLAHGR